MGIDNIAPINEAENLAKVTSGWGGGPFFKKMQAQPPMTITKGWPAEVTEKLFQTSTPTGTPIDSWNERRQK